VLELLVSLIPSQMSLCAIVLDLDPLVPDALIQLMIMIAVVLPVVVVIVLAEMLTVIEAHLVGVTMMMTVVAMVALHHVLVALLMIIHRHLVAVVLMIHIVEITHLQTPTPTAMEADLTSDHPQETILQEKPVILMIIAEVAVTEFSRRVVDRIRSLFFLMAYGDGELKKIIKYSMMWIHDILE